jgi:hypothetical protein
MGKFKVLRRVDAYVDYEVEVEAATPDEACEIASREPAHLKWREIGTQSFDARMFVTLDGDGSELSETERGDFA